MKSATERAARAGAGDRMEPTDTSPGSPRPRADTDDWSSLAGAEHQLARVPLGAAGSPDLIAGSAMHDEYAGATRKLFEWLFGPISYPAAAANRIRELAREGTVVYVARARTSLLGVYFNHALAMLGLPLARFVGGISLFLWQPVERLWRLLRQRRALRALGDAAPDLQPAEALLKEMALRAEPAFLFLPPETERRSRSRNDYLRALCAAQRESERPIFVVPHALVDRAQGGSPRGPITSRIFGASRRSGRLRELTLLLGSRHATVRVADAIDLRSLIAAAPDADDAHLARRLAHEVHRAISDEERVIAGPALPSLETTKRHVLRAPEVRAAIEALTKGDPKAVAAAERRAEKLVHEIAARYTVNMIRFLSFVMRWVFNRIYDGIVVDEEGLQVVLEASRKGPVILCPSHKSHVDYLVLSWVLWQHGVTPPHIAAGANLSFFPLGTIFRGGGAFFLRRSFKGDDLYKAVFRSYVAELVRAGTSIEFFPEGTRSRSGKLLPPKFGVLGMIVDAWRTGLRGDVQFVPVSIDYERIIEAGSYERELLGGEKKSEDIGALLRSTRVLRSRYGRVHVQFSKPVSLEEFARGHGLPQSATPDQDEPWRRGTERLGYRILYDVSQSCTVTPTAVTATALLGHRGRGIPQGQFLLISESISDYLYTAAARLSDVMQRPETRGEALLESVQKLVDEGVVAVDRPGRSDVEPIYRVREELRSRLDFHKNAVMNYFAPAAIVARAIGRRGSAHVDYGQLHNDARFLSRLFKREFLFQVGNTFSTHLDDALATLAVRGFVDVLEDGTVYVRDPATVAHIGALLDNFIEGYWITAQSLADLRQFPLWDKELALRARERARRAYLEGAIRRPEAATRSLIDSALEWMIETGVIEPRQEGRRRRMVLTPAFEGDRLTQLVDDIAKYL